MINNCGIYMIKNKINGKFYIGSSVNLKNRKNQHWARIRNETHENKILLRAFKKYSESSFEFCVIENVICSDQKYLIEREQYWMDTLLPFSPNGYNLSRAATGFRPLTDVIDANKLYLVYNLKGQLLHIFETIQNCSDVLNMSYDYIQHRIYDNDKGKELSRYTSYNELIFMSELKTNPIVYKIKTNRKFLIKECLLDNSKVEFSRMTDCAKTIGITKFYLNVIIRTHVKYKNHIYYYEKY